MTLKYDAPVADTAAVDSEAADRMTNWRRLFIGTGSLEQVITQLDWMRFERDTAGRNVRLVLYVEDAE